MKDFYKGTSHEASTTNSPDSDMARISTIPFGVSKTAPLHSPESNCGDKHAPLMPVKQEIWFHCSCVGILAIAQRLTKGWHHINLNKVCA